MIWLATVRTHTGELVARYQCRSMWMLREWLDHVAKPGYTVKTEQIGGAECKRRQS